jgi:hypothetical protein
MRAHLTPSANSACAAMCMFESHDLSKPDFMCVKHSLLYYCGSAVTACQFVCANNHTLTLRTEDCLHYVVYCSAQHYALAEHGEWRGWHCEGGPLRALFPLLMWDVLFMDVPGEC